MREELEFLSVEGLPWELDGKIEQRVLSPGEDGFTMLEIRTTDA